MHLRHFLSMYFVSNAIQVSLKIRSNQSNQHKRELPARSYLGRLLLWLRLRCHPCQRYPSLSKSHDQVCDGCLNKFRYLNCGCCSEIVKGHDYIVCTPWCGTRHGRRVTCDNFFPPELRQGKTSPQAKRHELSLQVTF